jgi:signal transduction histidine kinase
MSKQALFFSNLIFCLIFFSKLSAQDNFNFDSLYNALNKTQKTKATFLKYLNYIDTLPEENLEIIRVTGSWITGNCKNDSIVAAAKIVVGESLLNTSRFNESAALLHAALLIAEQNNYVEIHCHALNTLATFYSMNEQVDESRLYRERSLAVAEKNKYQKGIATAKYNLSGQFPDYGFPETRDTFNLIIRYAKEALQIFTAAADDENIIKVSMGLAESYAIYDYFDSAFLSMAAVPPYLQKPANKKLSVQYYFFMGKIYNQLGRFKKGDSTSFRTAIKYLDTCLTLSKQYNNAQHEMWALDWTASCYKRLEDFKNAYDYASKYYRKHIIRINSKNFTEISDIQHQFEQKKKDVEIANKSEQVKLLAGSAAALLVIGLLGYFNFRNRQKIQQQKIADLEKDKQLSAINAILKGQEEERSRLAKDLHDGLGGMLNGVKLSFNNIKEDLVMTADNVKNFERSVKQLDDTITELRKISHNLMPDVLIRFGLTEALEDYCKSISNGATKIVFQQLGTARQLNNTTTLYVYRIIQELVNNALKHAKASQIIAQLTFDPAKILITVEDDGAGFNTADIINSKGVGMSSIKQRLDYLNGTIDIDAAPGQGTAINIELTA